MLIVVFVSQGFDGPLIICIKHDISKLEIKCVALCPLKAELKAYYLLFLRLVLDG